MSRAMWAIVEKKNHLAIHGLFDIQATAERFIRDTIPNYVERRLFMDKTLTGDSFEVIKYAPKRR